MDGKGTFDGCEYYRIQRPEDSVNPYSSILPAKALSLEKPMEAGNEAAAESGQSIIFNGATVTMEAKEYEEKYITYEDMEPVTMYAIRYSEYFIPVSFRKTRPMYLLLMLKDSAMLVREGAWL